VVVSKTKNKSNLFKGLFYSVEEELKYLETEFLFRDLALTEFVKLGDVLSFLSNSGGKRLRPALVILCSLLCSKTPKLKKSHYLLATATELLHTATLIHDDLIDNSLQRRGQNSLYQEIGTKSAVLVGDYFFSQASYKISSLENLEINKAYAKTLSELCIGELKQAKILFKINESLKTYLRKSKYKTASLFSTGTFSAGVLSQFCFGEVLDNQAFLLSNFGNYLGLAFQIIDDLMDFGKTKNKPSFEDITSGILNAPVIFALRNEQHREEILSILYKLGYQGQTRNYDLLEKEKNQLIIKLLSLLETTGGLKQAKNLAKEYTNKAQEILERFPDNIYKKNLIQLIQFLAERDS